MALLAILSATCWAELPAQETAPAAAGPAGETGQLREALRLLDVDESVLRVFRDGQALAGDELEPIYRLLYVLPRLDDMQRRNWRSIPESWAAELSDPEAHRASLYELMGRVVSVQTRELPVESARRFGYDRFQEVVIQSTVDNRHLLVCARQIPAAWASGALNDAAGEPVSCDALFLKLGQPSDGQPTLVFATDRIAWHPAQVDPAKRVTAGLALLGSRGMDVSRFEGLAQQQPLGASDRECFYQLLWAARGMDPAAVAAAVDQTGLPVVRALQRPEGEAGRVYRLSGTARRALRIRVDDADIQARFGIDHYYEVEMFTPLEQELELTDRRDGQTRAYRNFPVTICVAELPADMPQGDEVRQAIVVDAFFMKLWSYRSQYAAGDSNGDGDPQRRQISPLLIARNLALDQTRPQVNPWPAFSIAAIVLGGVVAALLVSWWYWRGDRSYRRWRQAHGGSVQIVPPPEDAPVEPAE
jgi:hypothetical protein